MLYDRNDELRRLLFAPTPVAAVTGDPGSGKSAMLAEAAAKDSRLAAEPIRVPRRPGALQIALLTSLSAVVAARATEQGIARRLGELLTEAAKNVGQQRLRNLANAAAGFVIGVVKDRVGETVGGVLDDLINEVSRSASEQLQSRIVSASDPDVISVFGEFAKQVQQFVGRDLVLSLDDVDRLADGDFRQLQDLIEEMPDGVQLRLGHSIPHGAAAARVRTLEELGVSVIRLGGLAPDAVRAWLADAEVEAPDLGLIMRVTGGLPLHIDAAIAHLRGGGKITDMSVDETFAVQTKEAFSRLQSSTQLACLVLSAFTDPPTRAQAMELLQCSEGELLQLERELEGARMFVTQVDGRPWFHDLRRRAIWDRTLRPQDREYAARQALELILWSSREGEIPISLAMDFARLAPLAAEFCEGHDRLTVALGIDANALSIMAALLELIEPPGNRAVDADAALLHAQEAFATHGDVTGALRELQSNGLVCIAENEHAAVAVPTWGSDATLIALAGRIASELNRSAVPRFASVVFDVVYRPRLGEFLGAHYGIGQPRLNQLCQMINDLRYDRQEGAVTVRDVWGLITKCRLSGVGMYTAISFGSAEDRDRAIAQLEGCDAEVARQPVEVTGVWPWPATEPLRDLRFINAAELALDAGVAGPHGHAANMPERTRGTVEEELQLRARTLRVIGERAGRLERAAMDLDRQLGFVYFLDGPSLVVCEVAGLSNVLEVAPVTNPFGPFFRLELAKAAGLDPTQTLGRMSWSPGSAAADPLPAVLQASYQALNGFNSAQQIGLHRRVSLTENDLRAEIQQALDLTSADAAAMRDAGVFAGLAARPLYRNLYMVVFPGPAQPGWATGANGVVHSVELPAESENAVHLRVIDERSQDLQGRAQLQEHWNLDPAVLAKARFSQSSLTSRLPHILGFNSQWVRFER